MYVDKKADNKFKCEACGGKEMCEAHAYSNDHKRRVWYYCFGYGRQYGPGQLMNAVEKSVRHSKTFKYPGADVSTMWQEPGTAGGQQAASGRRWATAASQASRPPGLACAAETPVEEFEVDASDDDDQHASGGELDDDQHAAGGKRRRPPAWRPSDDDDLHASGVVATISDKLDAVLEMGCMEKAATLCEQLMEKLEGGLMEELGQNRTTMAQLKATLDEVKNGVEKHAPSVEAKVLALEIKIDEVKRDLLPTIAAKIDEVKELLESSLDRQTVQGVKLDMIERRIRAVEEQKGKPWQGSPTLGMRGCKSEGKLGSAGSAPAAEPDANGQQR